MQLICLVRKLLITN